MSALVIDADNDTDLEIDLDRWSELLVATLRSEGVVPPAEVGLRFVATDVMADLNGEHLGGSGPTDVLSFPLDEEPPEGYGPGSVRLVGDIVVCPEVAIANAPHHAGTVDDEIALLVVHATLHLLGHDHAEDAERSAMWAAEQRLLGELWGPLARDPWSGS